MAGQQFFSEEEAEQILRRAVQSSSSGVSRDSLIQAAAELGISAEDVDRAEREVATKNEESRLIGEYRASLRKHFIQHLSSFVSTNAFLIGIWYFTGAGYFWPAWILFFQGLKLIGDLYVYATNLVQVVRGNAAELPAFQKWRTKRDMKFFATPLNSYNLGPDALLDHWFTYNSPDEKLHAIRTLREKTGMDLRSAKDAVDSYYLRKGW